MAGTSFLTTSNRRVCIGQVLQPLQRHLAIGGLRDHNSVAPGVGDVESHAFRNREGVVAGGTLIAAVRDIRQIRVRAAVSDWRCELPGHDAGGKQLAPQRAQTVPIDGEIGRYSLLQSNENAVDAGAADIGLDQP